MRRLRLLACAVGLLAVACGSGEADPTTTASRTSDAPATSTTEGGALSSLPPTTTTVPATTTTTTLDPYLYEFGTPVITGDALPTMGPSPDPAVGLSAPLVEGADYDGSEVTLGSGGGIQAALFVAHWCPHCQNELPEIVQWLDETGGIDGVDFVLVTVGVDPLKPNFPPSEWIEREGWTQPVLRDDELSAAFVAYGGKSIPYWVFIAADGTVAARVEGAIGSDQVAAILDTLVE